MTTTTHQTKRPLYQKILVLFALMFTVAGTVTGIMTYVNVGFTERFYSYWLSSLIIALLTMVPLALISMTVISKLVQRVMPQANITYQRLVTGFLMAFVMEAAMAASTTVNIVGIDNSMQFSAAWQHAFIAALPFGLFMAVVMSFVLKPKLEKFMAN
ncbi:DUF2798 domain-containing protein [Rheinheimera baltica]|uniref:DUF2798 domain-containing protein n=1 Tax=Rheinheimera baltica TaxID=67576 RepID=UPI00273D184A|nr:DUF2798 domain-containing protein [Rheinheimera baltica]MDP5190212.1 DUF2798 domain-containing protein [Rheinheimera baltica]